MNRFILYAMFWLTVFIIGHYQAGVMTGLHVKNYWMISGLFCASMFLFQRLKKFGIKHFPEAFPFGKAFRILALILLPSVFAGSLFNEVYRKVIRPELAEIEFRSGKKSIEIKEVNDGEEVVTESSEKATLELNRNPLIMVSSSLVKAMIAGSLLAMIGAVLLRREPDNTPDSFQ